VSRQRAVGCGGLQASLPGLTRQSIFFEELLFSMDARVKPAHDD
jgi:hypothetical protein